MERSQARAPTESVSLPDNDTLADDVTLAHAHCGNNRSELLASEICGCFSCLEIFPPSAIVDWIDEGDLPLFRNNVLVSVNDKREQSAMCPECGINSVIGSRSGYPITPEFLERMERRWFSTHRPDR
jgi:hypothetical protein